MLHRQYKSKVLVPMALAPKYYLNWNWKKWTEVQHEISVFKKHRFQVYLLHILIKLVIWQRMKKMWKGNGICVILPGYRLQQNLLKLVDKKKKKKRHPTSKQPSPSPSHPHSRNESRTYMKSWLTDKLNWHFIL